ncbi:hypothetical protein AX16_004649 [Volvariella volvacea WC 439]|nr:hypothetical protein AX16_004649 [Volvariella volvacea WC 439]
MLIADIDNQIARIAAEVDALSIKLAKLRRYRNSLVPLSKLPVELVTQILKCIKEDTPNKSSFYWIPVTQFCASWREVALNYPALWTCVSTMSGRWFEIFLQRSQNQLLRIDTTSPRAEQAANFDEMFQCLADNMHRVHELSLRPHCNSGRLDLLQFRPAPQLQVLRYLCDNPNAHPLGPSNAPLRHFPLRMGAMPKLRQLEIDCSFTQGLDILLPPHLPTITDLSLKNLGHTVVFDLLRQCTAVRNLSVSNVVLPSQLTPPVRLSLPNLEILEFQDTPTRLLTYLAFPSLLRMNVSIPVYQDIPGSEQASQDIATLTTIFRRFNHLTHQDA